MSDLNAVKNAPDDLVLVGHVSGAFGLQGWVKIRPYSTNADALLSVKKLWIEGPAGASLREIGRLESKFHGEDVVAKLLSVSDRNAAEALKGAVIKVSRQLFPKLPEGEVYWSDLIGLQVVNLQGENLGVVRDMMDNGAQSILRVASAEIAEEELLKHERLIPFVNHFIKEVDQEKKMIVVDWGVDF